MDYKLPPGRWSSFNQWGQMLLSQRNNCWTSETKFTSQAGLFGVVWTPIDIFSLSSCLGNMSTTKGICQSSAQQKAYLAPSGITGINSLPKKKKKFKNIFLWENLWIQIILQLLFFLMKNNKFLAWQRICPETNDIFYLFSRDTLWIFRLFLVSCQNSNKNTTVPDVPIFA